MILAAWEAAAQSGLWSPILLPPLERIARELLAFVASAEGAAQTWVSLYRAFAGFGAAAVVGGLGSIPGAVVGAFVVGVGEEISVIVLDPSYRTAVGFVAILVVLSFRPRGLLGERAY